MSKECTVWVNWSICIKKLILWQLVYFAHFAFKCTNRIGRYKCIVTYVYVQ